MFHRYSLLEPLRKSLGWINLTHVCRRWRAIGLDLAPLWATSTCVFPANAAFFKTAISRSRGTNVTINLEKDLAEPKRGIYRDFVTKNPERIRELSDSVGNPRRWYTSMKNKTFPNLLVLSITAHGSYTNDDPGTFSINAPNLRNLTLSEPTFAVIAPQLRSLSLRCRRNRNNCSLDIILQSLRCAPAIEYLELWVPLHIQSTAGAGEPIALPNTKCIELSGSLAGCTAFCEKAIFAPDVDIVVDAMVPEAGLFTITPLLRALKSELARPSHDMLTLDTSGGGRSGPMHPCMNIALGSSAQAGRGYRVGHWPRVTLEIGISKKGMNDVRARDAILAEFLANVSTLDVKKLNIAYALDWSTFERAFKRHVFTSVDTVYFDFLSTQLLYGAMVAPSSGFPALRQLVVSKQRQSLQRQWKDAWNYLKKLLALATTPKLSVRMTSTDGFKYGTIGFPSIDAEGVECARNLTSEFVDERLDGDCSGYRVLEK